MSHCHQNRRSRVEEVWISFGFFFAFLVLQQLNPGRVKTYENYKHFSFPILVLAPWVGKRVNRLFYKEQEVNRLVWKRLSEVTTTTRQSAVEYIVSTQHVPRSTFRLTTGGSGLHTPCTVHKASTSLETDAISFWRTFNNPRVAAALAACQTEITATS